jgi:hypothetical protein
VDARLVPVNAFVGLTHGQDDLTSPALLQIGFRLSTLELPLSVTGGPAPGKTVMDAVAWHANESVALVVEAKSGANVEVDQAHRYHHIDPADLVRIGRMTMTAERPISVQVVYVVMAQHVTRISRGLDSLGYTATPIVGVENDARGATLTLHRRRGVVQAVIELPNDSTSRSRSAGTRRHPKAVAGRTIT